MSNKLLKKVVSDFDFSLCPSSQLKALIKSTLVESDLHIALLDSLSEGHVIIDSTGAIVYYNKSVYSLIPTALKNRISEGKRIVDVIRDRDVSKFIIDVQNGKEKPEPKDFTFQVGQEMRTIRVSFSPLAVEDNNYIDIRFNDISDMIRGQARLRRSENLASMTTMAAGIAHEIKNPLAAMKIHIQLMQKYLAKNGSISQREASRYINVLDEEIDHLNSIAVDFLYAVKPMNTEPKLSSINDIVNDLVSFLEPDANEKNIDIVVKLGEFLPRIELDGKYVRQALLNLVQNSFAAMPDGGTLSLTTKLDGDVVLVKVKDSGIGIDEEKLTKIFEPYFTTKATGTGLGLTTVYKVMKEHGGDIHVTSEVGKGTCFTLEFPVPVSQRNVLEDERA